VTVLVLGALFAAATATASACAGSSTQNPATSEGGADSPSSSGSSGGSTSGGSSGGSSSSGSSGGSSSSGSGGSPDAGIESDSGESDAADDSDGYWVSGPWVCQAPNGTYVDKCTPDPDAAPTCTGFSKTVTVTSPPAGWLADFFPDADYEPDAKPDCWLTVSSYNCDQKCSWTGVDGLDYVNHVYFAIDGGTPMQYITTVKSPDGGLVSSCALTCNLFPTDAGSD
jgi:hypothetical protein